MLVALSVFAIAATALSYVLIQTAEAQRGVVQERAAADILHGGIATVASAPYTDLADGTFSAPDPCPTGPTAASCYTVEGAEWRIEYQTSDGADGAVELTGSIFREGKPAGQATRTVVAPDSSAALAATTVRVLLTGEWEALDTLHLVRGGQELVSAAVEASPTVELTVPEGTCSSAEPCFLALADSAPFAVSSDGNYTLRPSDLRGAGAAVTQSAPGLVDLSADVREVADVTFRLEARQGTNASLAATDAGTVCVALTFNDGVAARDVISCNDDPTDPAELTFTTYSADGWQLPIPSDVPLTVTSTPETGSATCPSVPGMLGRVGGTWVPQGLCIDWTWGPVARVEAAGFSGTVEDTPVTLAAGQEKTATLIWSGAGRQPAAGYPGEELWAHPRAAQPCGTDGTCSPADGGDLEPALCPGLHCLSDEPSAPGMISPVWPDRLWDVSVGANTKTLVFDQVQPDAYTVTVTSLPADATITVGSVPVTAGQPLLSSTGGEETLTIEADIDPSFSGEEQLELRLDGAGRTRHVQLTLQTGGS